MSFSGGPRLEFVQTRSTLKGESRNVYENIS
jgi:hypothetical protein